MLVSNYLREEMVGLRKRIAELEAENERLQAILNTPVLQPFAEAVVHEARHQSYRWGDDHDESKDAFDWYWTLSYLSGKAARAAQDRHIDKALHHTVSSAAMLANWHRRLAAEQSVPLTPAAPKSDVEPHEFARSGDHMNCWKCGEQDNHPNHTEYRSE